MTRWTCSSCLASEEMGEHATPPRVCAALAGPVAHPPTPPDREARPVLRRPGAVLAITAVTVARTSKRVQEPNCSRAGCSESGPATTGGAGRRRDPHRASIPLCRARLHAMKNPAAPLQVAIVEHRPVVLRCVQVKVLSRASALRPHAGARCHEDGPTQEPAPPAAAATCA